MPNIIDLSVFLKDDLTIKSLTGEEYHIPGNFSTEFYLKLYNSYGKLNELQSDYNKATEFMKTVALSIIQLDHSKSPTMETINEQFNDFNVLKALIEQTMKYADELTNDPNSKSPTSN